MNFKQWLEEEIGDAAGRSSKPATTNQIAKNVASKAMTHPGQAAKLATDVMKSSTPKQGASVVMNAAGSELGKHPAAWKGGGATVDGVAKPMASALGMDLIKAMKGMKKK